MLRQLTQDEIQRLDPRFGVVGSLRAAAAASVERLGVRFEDPGGPFTKVAVVEVPGGEVFALRGLGTGDEAWLWVMAGRTRNERPEEAFERFMRATALDRALVLAVNDRWAPEEGWQTHHAGWGAIEVSGDGRTLTLLDLELPEGGPWLVESVETVEHADVVELTLRVSNSVEEDAPAVAVLSAPLGDRPVLDASLGRLVRPTPPPEGVPTRAVPWTRAVVHRDGVLVVRWRTGMAEAFAGVDVDLLDTEVARVTVREWRRGGKTGFESRVAVVPAPGVTAATRLVDPAAKRAPGTGR